MPTRYGSEALSHDWKYPTDVEAFLRAIGTRLSDPDEARIRVELFMLTHAGPRMPRKLRTDLAAAGLLSAPVPTRPDDHRH
jgi:hypothetical protein